MRCFVATCIVTATLAACGMSHTIDRDALAEIGVEHKLLLFDAENDVSIALDEREGFARQIRLGNERIRRVRRQIEDAQTDRERASQNNNEAGVKVADMAEDVFEMHIAVLEKENDLVRRRLEAQDAFILVSFAKYELAKAKLVKKNNAEGAADIVVEDFEAQVDEYVNAAKDERQDLREFEAEIDKMRKEWERRRLELERASGGGVGSPWADGGELWGG